MNESTAHKDALAAATTWNERLNVVRQLLIDRLRLEKTPDAIDPDASLFGTGLALDSVDAIEVVMSLEAAFKRRFRDEVDARRHLRTVATLVEWTLGK